MHPQQLIIPPLLRLNELFRRLSPRNRQLLRPLDLELLRNQLRIQQAHLHQHAGLAGLAGATAATALLPESIRKALARDPDTFVRTMAEKLLTYALGRGLTASDMPVVRGIVREAAAEDYRFSAIVLGIAQSVPFRMRKAPAPDAVASAE